MCIYIYIYIHIHIDTYAHYSPHDYHIICHIIHHNLPHYCHNHHTCIRQLVLDKWFPSPTLHLRIRRWKNVYIFSIFGSDIDR